MKSTPPGAFSIFAVLRRHVTDILKMYIKIMLKKNTAIFQPLRIYNSGW